MTIDSRSLLHRSSLALLVAWAIYTCVLTTGCFLSLVPKYRGEAAWMILVALACGVVLSGRGSISGTADAPVRFPVRRFALLVLCFDVVALALYAGSLSLGLLSDDFSLMDRAIKHEVLSRSWHLRPLPLMLWAFIGKVPGNGWPLHVTNILLHGLNAALVVALARRLGLSLFVSVVAGVFFICFPGSVEAVAWASGIQELLVTTWCLAFVLASGWSERPRLVVPLGMAALVAALASKETAVVAPVLAFAAWVGVRDRWNARPILWGLVLVVAYAAIRLSAFSVDASFFAAPSHYLTKELVSRAFSTLAVPFTGREISTFPAVGIATACVLAVLVVVAAWDARRDRRPAIRLARCAAWVLVPALPVWSAFFISTDLQGSRYLYLPACGWSILLATLLLDRRTAVGRTASVALAAAFVVAWCLGLRSHVRDWQEASETRDRVLASATNLLQQTSCAVVGFEKMPDSVGGAYVFRNGFLEALHARPSTRATSVLGPSTVGCTFEWRDGAFR